MSGVRVDDLALLETQDHALVRAAQALRYTVFFEELGAKGDALVEAGRLDADAFDDIADHLLVVDRGRSVGGQHPVVGCYRLLRGSVAMAHQGFYSAGEFDLGVFAGRFEEVVELGRSCVHADYRGGAVMQLLWRGVARYLERHRLRLMLGCASLPGTDVAALAPTLAYLAANHLAPAELRPRALPARCLPLPDPHGFSHLELERGRRAAPPLLKAYLRMGGSIGEGAVIDHAFNTVDVCLVLPTARLKDRYLKHLAAPVSSDALAA